MPLQKVPVTIPFAQGIDQKSDPKQIPIGKFASLTNRVFNKYGLLEKRNGFGPLPSLPDTTTTNLTTFGGNLTAIGSSIRAYAQGSMKWISKGAFQPIDLSVLPIGRSAINQTQCDAVTAPNGFVCTAFTQVNNGTSTYYYAVIDGTTGQYIVSATAIPVSTGAVSGSPRVFLVGQVFIIVFTNLISATSHLQYIAISSSDPTTIIRSNTDIASSYVATTPLSWDGIVVGNNLYIAYDTLAGGQQVVVTYLSSSFTVAAGTSFVGSIATIMSMTVDNSDAGQPVIYATFWDSGTSTGYAVAVDTVLNKLMSPTQWLATGTIAAVTSIAADGILNVIYDNTNAYSYDSAVPSNFISKNTITLPVSFGAGVLGSASVVARSVGLASKAFYMDSVGYFLSDYSSVFQPTYFLMNLSGSIIAKLAYENGGGYLTAGLPQAQVIDTAVLIPYLFKDLITSVNKTQGLANSAGIYSQTGINLATLDFSSASLSTSEIGGNLLLSGGFLYAYDGNTLNEQNFHVFPDNVEEAHITDPTPTATTSSVTNPTILTSVSSVANIVVGMNISGTGIPANTRVTAVGVSTITMNNAATASGTVTITFTGNVTAQQYFYQVIYQWTDAQGNIFNSAPSIPSTVTPTAGHSSIRIQGPNLRLTYKSGVKIIIYRWSTAQQNYYQITSLTAPLLNSTTTDSWSFQDINSDAQILGNGLIYTTGGVIENVGAPACTAITLFDTRLWLIDAEDQNLLWYSKQVIEGVPVEMSDLFTKFIAPNAGTAQSTGPLKCLFPMDDKLILFKMNALYYINGIGPDNAGLNSQYSEPIFINSTIGCSNQNSIVFTPRGLFFQSQNGIWLLGRDLSTEYIGAPVEDFNSQVITSAFAIPGTTQVRFTFDNKTAVIYDYYFDQWGEFSSIDAVSSTIYQNLHTYVTSTGIVSQETPGTYYDNGNPVLTAFETGWINLASLQGFQRLYYFYFIGTYLSPHKLQLSIAYDYNDSPSQSIIITPNNFSSALSSPFGDQPAPFGSESNLEQWQVHVKKQKCQSFKIFLREIYDPSFGLAAGAGLNLSGITMVVAAKKGTFPLRATLTAG